MSGQFKVGWQATQTVVDKDNADILVKNLRLVDQYEETGITSVWMLWEGVCRSKFISFCLFKAVIFIINNSCSWLLAVGTQTFKNYIFVHVGGCLFSAKQSLSWHHQTSSKLCHDCELP